MCGRPLSCTMTGFVVVTLTLLGIACTAPVKTESPLALESRMSVLPSADAALDGVGGQAEAPVPKQGYASLGGVLFSYSVSRVIPGTAFYLTPALGGQDGGPPAVLAGANVDHGDIRGFSDDEGHILVNDIPPGDYYLAVWAPYTWVLASKSAEDPAPMLINLEPDQRLSLGEIQLSWP